MNKKLLLMLSLLFSMTISGNVMADEIDDMFAGGEDQEFDFNSFGEDQIMRAIAHDAAIACNNGLCTLTSVDTRYREFSININGGIGNNANSGYGGYGPGDGNFISFNNNRSDITPAERLHAGVNMQVKIGRCIRSINIPRSLYYSINRYMYGLLEEDSSTRRSFTPADEAMIVFYTTVMKQAEGCR